MKWLKSLFGRKPEQPNKTLVFVDGDQYTKSRLDLILKRYHDQDIRWITASTIPKPVQKSIKNITALGDMSDKGKESADKYIAIAIQKAISDGKRDIVVVSVDYDFINIFKMLSAVNPDLNLNFTLLAIKAYGRLCSTASTSSINIIRI